MAIYFNVPFAEILARQITWTEQDILYRQDMISQHRARLSTSKNLKRDVNVLEIHSNLLAEDLEYLSWFKRESTR